MSKVVPIELPSGEQILARVGVEGPSDVGSMQNLQKLPIAELRRTVEAVARSVSDAIDRVTPDKVSVEFGIELTIQSGKIASVLAEASGKASLNLTLTWNTAHGRRSIAAMESGSNDDGGG